MNNVQTVQQMYEAFGRSDIPAILAKVADNVDWEYGAGATGVPWLRHGMGREAAAAFFTSLGQIDIARFEVKSILDGGSLVVSLIDIDFTVKATGKRVVEEDEVHIWRFDSQGKVARFRHRADTHQHMLACAR